MVIQINIVYYNLYYDKSRNEMKNEIKPRKFTMKTNKTLKGVIIGIIIVMICVGVATTAIILNYNKIFSQASGFILLSEEQYATANEATAKEKAETYDIAAVKKQVKQSP